MAIETTLDLLYFSLSISVVCLTVLASISLIRINGILKNVAKITETVQETAEMINNYIWKPIETAYYLFEFFKKYFKKK